MDVAEPRSKWARLQWLYREINRSGLFDSSWYRRHGGLARFFPHPLTHYLIMGWRKGLDPSPLFDTSHYLRSYRDVRESDANPLVHFVLHGHEEGRLPTQSGKALREALHPAAAPLPLFEVPGPASSRLTVVLDDNTPRLQVLGYLPVLALALRTAQAHGLTLRVVVRSDAIRHEELADASRAVGISPRPPLDLVRRSPGQTADIDELEGERWWATSHSAYLSLSGQVPSSRLTWLMLAEEQDRVGSAEERLRIRSLLTDTDVQRVKLADLDALPPLLSLGLPIEAGSSPRVLGVVCDPRSPDSLLARSVRVLEEALSRGILDPAQWVVRLLGPDLRPVTLTGSVVPDSRPLQTLTEWTDGLASSHAVMILGAGGEPDLLVNALRASGRAVVSDDATHLEPTLDELRVALGEKKPRNNPPSSDWGPVVSSVSQGWKKA